MKQGTSLRDYFFNDELAAHKSLKDRFPYEPDRPVADYVSAVRNAISSIKKRYPEADAAWSAFLVGSLGKYQLSGWNWAAWHDLDDVTVSEWRRIEGDANREFDIPSVMRLAGGAVAETESWAAVIDKVKADVADQIRKSEDQDRSKAKIWDVEVSLPLNIVLVFFPVGFFAGNVLLSAIAARRRLIRSEIATLAERLDKATGDDILSSTLAVSSYLRRHRR